jgi:hypothetical protein
MMQIVIFEDDSGQAGQIRDRVQQQLVGRDVNVVAYWGDWLENARKHSSHNAVWLVDLFGKHLTPSEKRTLNLEFRQFLDRNEDANRIYKAVPLHKAGSKEVSQYCGLAIAAMAHEKGVPFRIISSFGGPVGNLVAYLVTKDANAAAERYSFDKKYFATDSPSNHPDEIREYQRLVDFVDKASPGALLPQRTTIANEVQAVKNDETHPEIGMPNQFLSPSVSEDSNGPVSRAASKVKTDELSRKSNRKKFITLSGLIAIVGLGIAAFCVPQVQDFFKRRTIESATITDLQNGNNIMDVESNDRSIAHPLQLDFNVPEQSYSCDLSAYLLESDGDVHLLDEWNSEKRARHPGAGKKWFVESGYNVLVLITVERSPETMRSIQNNWGLPTDKGKGWADQFSVEPGNSQRRSLPKEIRAVIEILDNAYFKRDVDDYHVIGFSIPAQQGPTSPTTINGQP